MARNRLIYPVILIDAIVMKVRAGEMGNKPVYVAMGITLEGHRDVLGMWFGPTGGEGAKQWMNILTELKSRGVQDVLIVSCDGLKGLPESITATCRRGSVSQVVACIGLVETLVGQGEIRNNRVRQCCRKRAPIEE